eukprot:gi/632953368/ref/XP_007892380.1/ PREDICTED: immunoglobulin-like and fibronectin type III domain-containing protein 1 isoform X1 [Callorhinchus milii]
MSKNLNMTNNSAPIVKKSIIPGVTILQFVENIPEGCNAPNILRKPLPLTKPEGASATFKAVTEGNPKCSFIWSHKGKNLANGKKHKILHNKLMTEFTLQIKKLTISDAGYYKCTASNEYGEAFCTVNLIVAQAHGSDPADFLKILKKREATEKKEEFSEEYVWEILMEADKKDYEKICHKYGITNYRYMLKQLNQMKKEREEKQAEYVTSIANLKRVETKKDGSCTFGFEMDLKNPASKIFLYKNGEMISYDTEEMMRHYLKQVGKKYTFCIKDLQPDDVGMYRVDVEDATVFSTAIEESAIPVGFTYQLSDVKCEESEDAVFECASSVPLVANWTFGSQSLADGDKYQIEVSPDSLMHSLTVKDISPADSGLYTISAGELSSSARLILEDSNLSGKSSKHGQRRGLHGSDLDGLNKLKSSQDGTNSQRGKGDGQNSSKDGMNRMGKDGRDGLDGMGRDGSSGLDGMGRDGRSGLDGMGRDGRSGLDGMGRDGRSGLDGMGRDGRSGLDGMGRDGLSGLDGMGRDGRSGLDGMGKDGRSGLDGMGRDGRSGLDGMGRDGRSGLDGMGRDGRSGLDGMGRDGRSGLDGMGRDGSSGVDGMGRDGSSGLDGMGRDGRGGLDGMGRDGRGGLDGMGRDGHSGLDGTGKDGRAGLDGMGRDGSSGLDGMGKDGSSGMDRMGRDGSSGLDGMGRDGSSGLDGMGRDGSSGLDGMGRDGRSGLDGMGRDGSSGLDGMGKDGRGGLDGMGADGLAGSGGDGKTGFGGLGNNLNASSHIRGKDENDSTGLGDSSNDANKNKGLSGASGSGQDGQGLQDSTSNRDDSQKGSSRRRQTSMQDDSLASDSARHFKTGLSNVSVRKGQDTELCCVLASEMSDGCWYKNGKKIIAGDKSEMVKDGTKHTLKLHNVQEEDSGIYRFESDGRKTEASLLIEEPPELDQDVLNQLRKKPITVKAGHTATVKVPFSGKPPVKATWSKDGDELLDDRRISISNDGKFTRLSISNCSRKDRGKLSVKLRNESGTTETFVADLLVTDKPLSPQGPVEVVESSEHCIAIKWKPVRDDGGVPLSHYTVERQQVGRNTWNKVGDVDKDTTTISTDKVEPQKKYMFRIWAVNPEGVSESLVSDAVAAGIKALAGPPAPPKIVTSSSKAIKLSWAAPRSSGGLRLTGYFIEKRKKGSNIWNTINEEPIPDLQWIVTDVVAGQEYEFRVIAVNSSGRGEPSGESESVFAREPMDPPGIVKDLRVTYSDYSSISLAWTPPLRQNNDFAEGYLVEVKSFGSTTWTRCNTAAVNMTSYTVKGLKEMGKYSLRVTAVNSGGMGTPLELDRYVFAMPPAVCPKFVLNKSINKFMVIEEGNSIRTQFSFEGSPPPEVTWLKDGLPLSKEATIINTTENSQLFIPASQRSDSGIYSIFLKNFFGQESFDFEIRVTAIPKPPGPLTLDENVPNTVTVSWESSWDEHLDDHLYYVVKKRDSSRTAWHTVGNNIFNNRFTIINIIPERKYYFRVLAKNDMAFSDPSDTKEPWSISKKRDPFTLKLPTYKEVNKNRVPVFSVKLKTHIVPSGCDVNMSCAVEGYPLPQVTWYKNNIALENNRNYWSTNVCGVCSLCIFGASPNDSGLYTAIAENSLGRAMCSTTLTITE